MSEEFPRVQDLIYRLILGDGHLVAAGATTEGELPQFRFQLHENKGTFYPLIHFRTEEDARTALEPLLHAWEIHSALRHGKNAMRFKFLTSFVQPGPELPNVVYARTAAISFFGMEATVTVTHAKHPRPPEDFVVNDCVEDLSALFLHSKENPLGILKDAYSMVTRLEFEFGGLTGAAETLNISQAVLREMRKISTTRGTGAEVRKFDRSVARTPLEPLERDWLARIMELLVRRAGAAAAMAPVGELVTLQTTPIREGG